MQNNNEGNINKNLQTKQTAVNFVNYYYNSWISNPLLLNDSLIKHFSCLKYEDKEYMHMGFITFMNDFRSGGAFNIIPLKMEYIDSGSRRIDINMIGNMSDNNSTKLFSQTFSICYNPKSKWFIKNSTLIIM